MSKPDMRAHGVVGVVAFLLFIGSMFWLPFERANPFNDAAHRVLKYVVYSSGGIIIFELLNLKREIDGRPYDDDFTEEATVALLLLALVLLLSESGLFASSL